MLTYREMNGPRRRACSGPPPAAIVKVPVLTPAPLLRTGSRWSRPVETGLVRPLVDGLKSEMVVEHAPPAGINDAPLGFDDAVRAAG